MKQKTIGYQAPQYYHDQIQPGYPEVFEGLFQEFALKAQKTPEPCWNVKFAEVLFMYEGKAYSVRPGNLKCSVEVFEVLSNELIDRMYELGAYEMFYGGMLD